MSSEDMYQEFHEGGGWRWFEKNRRRQLASQSGLSGPSLSVWLARKLGVWVCRECDSICGHGQGWQGPSWAVRLAGWLGVRA